MNPDFQNSDFPEETYELAQQVALLGDDPGSSARNLRLRLGETQLAHEQSMAAWDTLRPLVDLALAQQDWEQAAYACALLSETDHPDAVTALGQGIWLAVTYPVEAALSVRLLETLVDQTPPQADGAAVAAAVALYLCETRAPDAQNLLFFARQRLSQVAERHSQVTDQETFSFWCERLGLLEVDLLFRRLRQIIDVLVDEWWFDWKTLQSQLPH